MDISEVKVDIILASYNGELFIEEQIRSILNQTHQNINLIITDDSSNDNTKEIVDGLMLLDKRIRFYKNETGSGVVSNFNNGLRYSTAEYILFSDQDDVWKNNKVELLLNEIIAKEVSDDFIIPCLIFSNLSIVNEDLSLINNDFYAYNKLNPINNTKIEYLKWRSSVYGCSLIFNRKLLVLAGYVPLGISMHDHWFAFHAALKGKICFFNQSLVLYRQHRNNVVGAHKRSFFQKIYRGKKTFEGIYKAINSSRELETIYARKMQSVEENKINFILRNVIPFATERKLYTLFFVLGYLCQKQ